MNEEIYIKGKYIENNPTWHVEDSYWKAKQILKIIERNNLQPSSICEVGCGAGEILNQLCIQMHNDVSFTGYEISPQAYQLCQKLKNWRLKFYLRDLLKDAEDTLFDIVLAIDVIEHIEDYFSFLRKLHGKSEFKIFHIPLDISVQTVLRSKPFIKVRQSVGHIHYFTKETAFAMLTDTGYKILDYFYTASSVDFPAKSFKSLLAKLPRKLLYKFSSDLTVRLFGGYSLLVLAQ